MGRLVPYLFITRKRARYLSSVWPEGAEISSEGFYGGCDLGHGWGRQGLVIPMPKGQDND